MALDPATKRAQDNFVSARKSLPPKVPDAAKKEYATMIGEADIWMAQLKNYAAAVEKALDHTAYDRKQQELDKAKDDINNAVNLANQIKSNYFSSPQTLLKLAQKAIDKDGDLSIQLTKLTAAASAINGLKLPDKIP